MRAAHLPAELYHRHECASLRRRSREAHGQSTASGGRRKGFSRCRGSQCGSAPCSLADAQCLYGKRRTRRFDCRALDRPCRRIEAQPAAEFSSKEQIRDPGFPERLAECLTIILGRKFRFRIGSSVNDSGDVTCLQQAEEDIDGMIRMTDRKNRVGHGRTHAHANTGITVAIPSKIMPPVICIYGVVRYNIRGNAMVSRMCSSPHIQATKRSTPMPNPPCGTLPYLRRSRYQLKASGGRLCS